MRAHAGWLARLVGGVALLGCCVTAMVVLSVPAQYGTPHLSGTETIYDSTRWALLMVLTVGSVLTILLPGRGRSAAAGVSLTAALQLAGTGVVAHHHWLPYAGTGPGTYRNLSTLRELAVALTVVALVAVGILLWILWCSRAFQVARGLASWLIIVAGVVIVPLVPRLLGAGRAETLDRTSLLGYAVLYSLPWGVAVVLAAFMRRPARLGLLAGVASSAIAMLLASTPMKFELGNASAGFGVAAAIGLLAAAIALLAPTTNRDVPSLGGVSA